MLNILDRSGNGMGVGIVDGAFVQNIMNSVGVGDATQVLGQFDASLRGTFVATFVLERSLDNRVTWNTLTVRTVPMAFTGPCEEVFLEPGPGVWFRWRCSSYTSGSAVATIRQ